MQNSVDLKSLGCLNEHDVDTLTCKRRINLLLFDYVYLHSVVVEVLVLFVRVFVHLGDDSERLALVKLQSLRGVLNFELKTLAWEVNPLDWGDSNSFNILHSNLSKLINSIQPSWDG